MLSTTLMFVEAAAKKATLAATLDTDVARIVALHAGS